MPDMKYAFLLSCYLACFCILPVAAAEADLLGVLEAEAEHEELDSANIAGSTSSVSQYHSDRYERFMAQRQYIPENLTQQEFKVFLFNEFFETYANYIDLSKTSQHQIYEYYQSLQTAEVTLIDGKILELLAH